MEHFIGAIKQYAAFSGRATRKEYWMYILFYVIFYILFAVVDNALNMMLFTTIFSVALLIPSLSVAARRLHDTGRSGWWQLIALIPLIGTIILIVFLAQDSHDDENEYGLNPKLA